MVWLLLSTNAVLIAGAVLHDRWRSRGIVIRGLREHTRWCQWADSQFPVDESERAVTRSAVAKMELAERDIRRWWWLRSTPKVYRSDLPKESAEPDQSG